MDPSKRNEDSDYGESTKEGLQGKVGRLCSIHHIDDRMDAMWSDWLMRLTCKDAE